MQKFRNGKVRRSREEWTQIIGRFRASGMSASAFCRREKLAKSSFEKWKKKIGKGPRAATIAPSFVEWPMSNESEASLSNAGVELSSGAFELSLPGGVMLRWKP